MSKKEDISQIELENILGGASKRTNDLPSDYGLKCSSFKDDGRPKQINPDEPMVNRPCLICAHRKSHGGGCKKKTYSCDTDWQKWYQ